MARTPGADPDVAPAHDPRFVADAAAMADAVAAVRRDDAASVPVLSEQGRAWLRDAAARLGFRRARPVVGQGDKAVTQAFEICTDPPWDGPFGEAARVLGGLVNAGLARMTERPCADIAFNEAMVQRYPPSPCGISPHRDHIRYTGLIGILVIDGAGAFYVCDDRAGNNARAIPAPAGSFLLMRAPGFDGSRHRPFHMLGAVTQTRLIAGYRQDTRPGEPD